MENQTVVRKFINTLDKELERLQELDSDGCLLLNEFAHKRNQINSIQIMLSQLLEKEKNQCIDFHIETLKAGLINDGEEKWSDEYLPKIKKNAEEHFDKLFRSKN